MSRVEGVAGSPKNKVAMVVSAHPLASNAGVWILKQGGNAVDAAVATALTLGVVSPAFSGIGGGGFMLIHDSRSGRNSVVDYRECAPIGSSPNMFRLDSRGEVVNDENSVGFKAIATPATLSGLSLALERFGTKSFSEVSKKAVRNAQEGFTVNKFLSRAIHTELAKRKFARFSEASTLMFQAAMGGENRPVEEGNHLAFPKLGTLIEAAAKAGARDFYCSEFAKKIGEFVKSGGGLVSEEDFKRYQPKIREALQERCGDFDVISIPPPSSGGICMIQLLKMLLLQEDELEKQYRHNSAKSIGLIARCLGRIYEDRRNTIADPDFVPVDIPRLVSDSYVDRLSDSEGVRQGSYRTSSSSISTPSSQTSHLTVVDFEGNIVALTESLECYFGSGVVVPEMDLFLNDTMHDFDPDSSSINSISPMKRPRSSMSPTILLQDGRPFLALGSAGGPRIISSVLQVILNVARFGMELEEAVQSPRIHYEGGAGSGKLYLESGITGNVKPELVSMGYDLEESEPDYFFGGVHAVHFVDDNMIVGAADPRRNGLAVRVVQ